MVDAQAQLDGFIDRYAPATAALARALLARMEKRLPGATMLVYDNYNALVIGFGASEKPTRAILSLAVYPRWVTLFFLTGVDLPDPHRLLQGSGSQVRSVRLPSVATLDDPRVNDLIAEAVARSDPPLDPRAEPRLIIRSVSAKQRPRR